MRLVFKKWKIQQLCHQAENAEWERHQTGTLATEVLLGEQCVSIVSKECDGRRLPSHPDKDEGTVMNFWEASQLETEAD